MWWPEASTSQTSLPSPPSKSLLLQATGAQKTPKVNPPTMPPTFIIEHLDPELEAWQTLEYQRIASDCAATHRPFFLSGVPAALRTPPHPLAHALPASALPDADVRRLCAGHAAARVCLLDPRAERDLAPEEGGSFDVFVVGGILGDDPPRGVCCAEGLRGGLLIVKGTDRTAELRGLGFVGRRLGAEQMTTDTAVRVAWMVVGEGSESLFLFLLRAIASCALFFSLLFVGRRCADGRCGQNGWRRLRTWIGRRLT